MEQEISIGIAKYFFTMGLDLDLDNVVCREYGSTCHSYSYKDDLILSVDYDKEIIKLHYVRDIK